MDPILLSLFGLVILFSFLLVITFVLWIRAATRETNDCRLVIAFLRKELREKDGYSPDWSDAVSNLIDFALAYYKRTRARGEKKVGSANTAMAICWRKLPDDSQEKLAILGGLANLRVGDNFPQ